MTSKYSTRVGKSTSTTSATFSKHYGNRSYVPIWISALLAWPNFSIWDTLLMNRGCMWIQPRSKSFGIGQLQPLLQISASSCWDSLMSLGPWVKSPREEQKKNSFVLNLNRRNSHIWNITSSLHQCSHYQTCNNHLRSRQMPLTILLG